jgi:hypothetical protein
MLPRNKGGVVDPQLKVCRVVVMHTLPLMGSPSGLRHFEHTRGGFVHSAVALFGSPCRFVHDSSIRAPLIPRLANTYGIAEQGR